MYKKSLGIFTAVSLMGVSLAACGGSTSGGGSGASGGSTSVKKGGALKVAFANYDESGPVFHSTTVELKKQLEKTPNIGVQFYNNGGDPSKMLENARLMVQSKPDVIIEYPVTEDSKGVQQIFKKSGIPCIALNIPMPGCSFINIDNNGMGTAAGNLAASVAQQKGWSKADTTVLIGQNAAAGPAVNGNITYFYSAFAKKFGVGDVSPDSITPTTTTIGSNGVQFDGKSDQNISFTAVQALLSGIPKSRHLVVYTVNDDETFGAYRAVTQAGRAGNTIVIGHGGGRTDTIAQLRDNANWVGEDAFFEPFWGEYVIAMAQVVAKGGKTPAITSLPSLTLTKKTYTDYFDPKTLQTKQLPPLDANNQYLKSGGFLQTVGNIKGL